MAPALVIHGTGMRDEAKFDRIVAGLNEAVGSDQRLVPVFWGDLGASRDHLDRLMLRYEQRSANVWSMLADSLTRPIASLRGRSRAWVTKRRGDREAAHELKALSKQNARAMDARVRGYLQDKFQNMRLWLTSAVLPFIADVIVYQSHDYRAQVHRRVREVIDRELGPRFGTEDKPVHVIAHSLGGIIGFDMAMAASEPLHIDHFITVGSQPAFFHVLDPRPGGLEAFTGDPVTLKPSIHRWTNIWDEFDMLAFNISEVFRLHDGSLPVERPIKCYRTALEGAALMQSHMGYWDKEPAIEAIGTALRGLDAGYSPRSPPPEGGGNQDAG